jgi:hypothetical protein
VAFVATLGMVASLVSVGPAPADAASTPALSAYGTPIIDGVITPGEWDRAARIDLAVDLPPTTGGGSVPSSFLVMNDEESLYIALRVGVGIDYVGMWIEFDNDGDGVISEQGDDGLGAIREQTPVRFFDYARIWCTDSNTGRGMWCAPSDTFTSSEYPVAGTTDGRGAGSIRDGMVLLEMSHPLDSADDARDFSLGVGAEVGFQASIQLADPPRSSACSAEIRCAAQTFTSGRIKVAAASSSGSVIGPAATALVSPSANPAGWWTSTTRVLLDGGPGTARITYWATPSPLSGYRPVLGGQMITATTHPGDSVVLDISAPGTTYVHCFAVAPDGRTGPWQTAVVRIDPTPPALSPPVLTFLPRGTLGAGSGTTRIDWIGVDAFSAHDGGSVGPGVVLRYDLQESAAGSAFATVASTTAKTAARHLRFGAVYRYRIRGIDPAGNVSAWTEGPAYRVLAVDSGDPRIILGGRWQKAPTSGAVGGATVYSSAAGATATLRFYGSAVAWVSATGPGHRVGLVSIDGRPDKRIALTKPTASSRVVWSISWSVPGRHTIRVSVPPAAEGGARVDLDAFLVISPQATPVPTILAAGLLPAWVSNAGRQPVVRRITGPDTGSPSGGPGLAWDGMPTGELRVSMPISIKGRYRVTVYAETGPDHGDVELGIEGHPAIRHLELFAPSVGRTAPLDLGTVDLWGPSREGLRITVTGKDSRSMGYAVELDSIVLTPVGE